MNTVGIMGFGRFGKILAKILEKGFQIRVFDPLDQISFSGVEFVDLDTLLTESVIFVAVPIRAFETVITGIAPKLGKNTTIIDVCSVKIHPVEVMKKHLPESTGIIATHPLFGPDSYTSGGTLKMIMNATRDTHGQFNFWSQYFSGQGIKIITLDPETHDRLAAQTQGVTHFLGRTLKAYGIHKTALDTQGFRDLLDLVDQTCNDTWELYSDLQRYNPYTRAVVQKLGKAVQTMTDKLDANNHK